MNTDYNNKREVALLSAMNRGMSSSTGEMMSKEEFTEWYLKLHSANLAQTDPVNTDKKQPVNNTPAAVANTPNAAGGQDRAAEERAEAVQRRRNTVLRHIWNLIKCLFLTFLLTYDGNGASSGNFVIGALVLFFINVIQNGNMFDQIVVVRRQPAQPDAAPEAANPPVAEGGQAREQGGDDNGAETLPNAVPQQQQQQQQQPPVAQQPPPPPPVGKVKIIIRIFVVFVESLLPSWTLRELDRY
eukprot:TRINITY_DN420_c3_g1_i1.p1 TRINITY_DN420_c3_g1~~TRINITY_DN420_c3_g1_i1.p1  ORF type:complete len:261 (+),score=73.68 TRINITY_DN420_c3_g1_i1:56-784(+)